MSTTEADAVSLANAVVARLDKTEATSAQTTLSQRAALLTRLAELIAEHAAQGAAVGCQIKSPPAASPLAGEEWITGPWTFLSHTQALRSTLQVLARGGNPLAGVAGRPAPGGRLAFQVLPHARFDRPLLNGYRAEVWTGPGVTPQEVRRRTGHAQRDPRPAGYVSSSARGTSPRLRRPTCCTNCSWRTGSSSSSSTRSPTR